MNNTNTITISLVIPTFNRGDLIKETIDSAIRQTLPFFEIIVVDDGSTDNTSEILAQYGSQVKVIRLSRGGVQAARNAGVEVARGKYIALCDSDDLLEPTFLEYASRWLSVHTECDAFYCNFVTFDQKEVHADKFSLAPEAFFCGAKQEGEFLYDVPDLYMRTLAFQPLFMSGCIVRKEFYDHIGGFNTEFNNIGAEDWEFTLRVIAEGRVALCVKPLVRVRRHLGNDSYDSLRQVHGTIKILEYALIKHPQAKHYREMILRSIDERRVGVFNAAFSRGNFEIAFQMLSKLRIQPRDSKLRIKAFITRLPSLLRKPLWRITVSVRPSHLEW